MVVASNTIFFGMFACWNYPVIEQRQSGPRWRTKTAVSVVHGVDRTSAAYYCLKPGQSSARWICVYQAKIDLLTRSNHDLPDDITVLQGTMSLLDSVQRQNTIDARFQVASTN